MRRALLLAIAVIVAACQGSESPSRVSADEAGKAALAAFGQGRDAKVIATRRSTFGAEAPMSGASDPATVVWAVSLSGTFEPGSCGPAPATTETPNPARLRSTAHACSSMPQQASSFWHPCRIQEPRSRQAGRHHRRPATSQRLRLGWLPEACLRAASTRPHRAATFDAPVVSSVRPVTQLRPDESARSRVLISCMADSRRKSRRPSVETRPDGHGAENRSRGSE